jgi:uncharacterized protein (DUF736 family)
MSYDNTNTGILFLNDQGDNPKRPNYKGKIDVEGIEYPIAGWIRQSKNGAEFISLKVDKNAPAATQANAAAQNIAAAPASLEDERGPF